MERGNLQTRYASEEKAEELIEWYLEGERVDPRTADRVADLREDASPIEALRLILESRGRIGGRRHS